MQIEILSLKYLDLWYSKKNNIVISGFVFIAALEITKQRKWYKYRHIRSWRGIIYSKIVSFKKKFYQGHKVSNLKKKVLSRSQIWKSSVKVTIFKILHTSLLILAFVLRARQSHLLNWFVHWIQYCLCGYNFLGFSWYEINLYSEFAKTMESNIDNSTTFSQFI